MKGKFKLIWLVLLWVPLSLATANVMAQGDQSVRLLVNNGFFGNDNGQMCQTLFAFIVNNSSDTLKYWGHDANDGISFWSTNCQHTDLFTVSKNEYFHLLDTGCTDHLFKCKSIPPHRSQLIPLKLFANNVPDGIIRLNIQFKLYRFSKPGGFEEDIKKQVAEILTDSVILKFDKGDTQNNWRNDVQKIKLIPPVKDIHLLTDSERNYYTLKVVESDIKRAPKWDYGNIKDGKAFLVPVAIYNNSDKVLKYLSMSCSADDYYHINNENFVLSKTPCESNFPIIVSIEPYKFHTEIFHITYKSKKIIHLEKFKLGLNINEDVPGYLNFLLYYGLTQYNIVWSNEIQFTPK